MPRAIYDKEAVVADWKTGKYTEIDLASKYRISRSTVHNIVKGIEKSIKTLITKQVEINQEVAELNNKEITLFKDEVEEQTKNLLFFKNATMKNVSVMMGNVVKDSPLEPMQHKIIQDAIKSGKETVFGKDPELVVNNNNQVARFDLSSATAHEQSLMIELLEGGSKS